jgi:signal transduction histidine kinase
MVPTHNRDALLRSMFWPLLAAWACVLLVLLWFSGLASVRMSERSFARLIQGPALAVAEIMNQTPEDFREQKLEALQSQFQFPIALRPRADVHLSAEDEQKLERGAVAYMGDEDNVYVALGTDMLIQLGPIADSAAMDDVLREPVYWLSALMLLAPWLFAALWYRQRQQVRWEAMACITTLLDSLSTGQPTDIPRLASEWQPMVGAIRSTTQYMAAMQERHKDVSQSVSHELRTPLSRMRFALALLARCQDEQSRERLQDRLLNDVVEMESLVRASLTFSRLVHAPAALARESINIRDWLEDEIAALESSEHTVRLDISSDQTELVGDRGLLHLVVRNLLTNAVKYGRGHVHVLVQDTQDKRLQLQFDDDGPGILQGDLERVFEPFVRLTQQQQETPGFGLGLAIVKRAVHWQQGDIAIGRSPLGGARFTVTLPRQL